MNQGNLAQPARIIENRPNQPPRIGGHRSGSTYLTAWVAAFFGLAAALSLQATVLDNFSSPTRTGWTDTPNGGRFMQSNGQLEVITAASAKALTYGAKTSQSFANAANQTLEFRVNVNTVTPGNGNVNPVAILAWLPSGAVPGSGSSGYSLSVSAGVVTVQKGAAVLYSTNYTAAGTNVQNTNITLVLRMTPSGGDISVNARVYQQTGSLPMLNFTEVFEYTATVADSVGTPGYAALGVGSGGSTSGAAVYFANLQVFVLTDSVLDDFSGGSGDLANYSVTGYGAANISGGQLELATPTYSSTIYKAARKTSPNFELTDGSRLELSVDIMNNATGPTDPYAIAVLGYTPFNSDAGVGTLVSYHIGAGCYALYIGKAYGQWWVNGEMFPYTASTGGPVSGSDVRIILSMTGEGASCRVDSRVEDLSVGVNDPARLLYQNVFVDTAGVDPLDTSTTPDYPDGTGLPWGPAAYLNQPGSVVLLSFFGGNSTDDADITYGNLLVNQTMPASLPPSFSSVSPPDGSNYMASATPVSFNVNDDVGTPVTNIVLALNGVNYTSTSTGVSITGTAQSRVFTLTGALERNLFYKGSLQATDSLGLASIQNYSFDTFDTNACYDVEIEDYNYGGGSFTDYGFPGEWQVDLYAGVTGVEGIDFHDNRTGPDSSNDVYRQDNPSDNTTGDGPRARYVRAGDPEIVVVDRENGDWMNYTHTYPEGYYNAYMRMSQYNLGPSLITLERVTSDPTQPNQTTAVLGAFLGVDTGYDVNRNVPLTDAFGNPVLVHFSGAVDTLRVNNQVVQSSSSDLFQNYMVFAPAATPASMPPFVATVTPLPGAVVGVGAPSPGATIVNRDTSVDTASLIVEVNGAVVASSATASASGATVTWTPEGTTPTLTNTLIFKDNAGVWQTNAWVYTYAVVLEAANSLPIGSLSVPGFDARMVQSSAANISGSGGLPNSVASAQAVLAIPPAYAVDLTTTNIVQLVAWDLNATLWGAVTNFPGLCIPPANVNSFAVETFAYLQLTAGAHRFYVDSDDDVGIYSGANLADTSNVVLDTTSIGVAHTSFDFLVPADGLYPFHIIYEEGGGQAYLVLHSVNLADNTQTLLNAPGGVNAFYPLVCKSAASAAGPYTVDAAANAGNVLTTAGVDCDGLPTSAAYNLKVTGGTLTVPISGPARFYRLDGPRATRITGITKSGSSVVITYETP
jgi:hypothetical protein